MSLSPYWQLLGFELLIFVFVLIERCLTYSWSLPEEDISLDKDLYHWETKEIYPLSLMEEQSMPISKINVQQYLTPSQRNEFYINSMKVESKGGFQNAGSKSQREVRWERNRHCGSIIDQRV